MNLSSDDYFNFLSQCGIDANRLPLATAQSLAELIDRGHGLTVIGKWVKWTDKDVQEKNAKHPIRGVVDYVLVKTTNGTTSRGTRPPLALEDDGAWAGVIRKRGSGNRTGPKGLAGFELT